MPDDRLIVALDVADALTGLTIAQKIGDQVGHYKIGLAMLTGGGLALANELKQDHGKPVIVGGPHPTTNPEFFLDADAADVCVQGEGDETLPELLEVICEMPAMRPSERSSGVATVDAMVSGLAPERLALTTMVGNDTLGSGATGSRWYASRPSSTMPRASSVVATGRLTKGLETLKNSLRACVRGVAGGRASARRAGRRRGRSRAW